MDHIIKVITNNYFPKEVPSEFQTVALANAIKSIDFNTLNKKQKSIWSKPILYSIPKSENFRRILSIPSPLHQILLSKLIVEKWEDLQDHFNLSKVSMTTPIMTDEGIKPKIDISEKMNIRIKNLHNKNYILQTDISRYYPTIYTHVIPWALHTKEYAKQNIQKKSLLGNKIDTRIQLMQDGQTFGIPTGPLTSLVIAEIIGTAIDVEFQKSFKNPVSGFRYTDDIEYYFETENDAKEALNILHKVVNEYQLELNSFKTKILKSPIEFEPDWKYYFTNFSFRKNVHGQKNDINSFFSKAFGFTHKFDDRGILKYAIKKVRREIIHTKNWELFESLLLHCAFSDSNTIPIVLEILEGYNIKNYPLDKLKIKSFIEETIKINFPQHNHFEVSWALVFAKRLNIEIEEPISQLLLSADDSITCILTMMIYSKGQLKGNLDFSNYKSFLNKEELYGSNWLFTYESYVQGWLKPYTNPNYVLEDPFFKQLYENNISFLRLDESIQEIKDGKNRGLDKSKDETTPDSSEGNIEEQVTDLSKNDNQLYKENNWLMSFLKTDITDSKEIKSELSEYDY